MKQKLTIGNVCFIKDCKRNKILLLKRKNEPMKGLSTGIGGKTHFDEDIKSSCLREIKEETGLEVRNVRLTGVIKTILQGADSSWILFVYTADKSAGEVGDCDEGELVWVDSADIYSQNLIGFIRKLLPLVLDEKVFFEGTITHDIRGVVLRENLILLR